MACVTTNTWLLICLFHVTGPLLSTPPSLPDIFGMTIKRQSEPEKEIITCEVAFNRQLGNLLRVSWSTYTAHVTKIYAFNEDVLYRLDGATGKWRKTQGIPDSERNDPTFPVVFHVVGNRKVFDPNSLILSDGVSKRLAQSFPDGVEEWTSDISATVQGCTYQCITTAIWGRDNGQRCDILSEGRVLGDCPIMAQVSCNGRTASRLSVHSYTEDPDASLFQTPQDIDSATTTDPEPNHASGIELTSSLALFCLVWLYKMRLQLPQ